MSLQLHYLTVQDVLWINLQVTGRDHGFVYAKLEEATYYQYAYGDSNSLIPQAARFVRGFCRMQPLDSGSRPTAFIGLLTFLTINGMSVELTDANASPWFETISQDSTAIVEAIKSIAKPSSHEGHSEPDIRKTIRDLVDRFSKTLTRL
ncbi:MAG: hypothetical protein P4L46_05510 [Fimbriimonas sp.]|nr:hypothetical protein [Fimbriimonas sp.]